MFGMQITRKILAEFLLRYGCDGWNSFPDDVDPLPWKPRCSKKKTCMDLHFGCEILTTQPRDCYDLLGLMICSLSTTTADIHLRNIALSATNQTSQSAKAQATSIRDTPRQ
jgi:hypothetical protein